MLLSSPFFAPTIGLLLHFFFLTFLLKRETRCQLTQQIRQLEASMETRLADLASNTEDRFEKVDSNLRAVEADNRNEMMKVCMYSRSGYNLRLASTGGQHGGQVGRPRHQHGGQIWEGGLQPPRRGGWQQEWEDEGTYDIHQLEASMEARLADLASNTEDRFEKVDSNLRAVEADNRNEKTKVRMLVRV
jgi:hypothetical protein